VVEASFAQSMERSMGHLKRMFVSEFTAMLRRPVNQAAPFDVDAFVDELSLEVGAIVEAPVQTVDCDVQSVGRLIASAIDDHTKPVNAILSEAKSRNVATANRHLVELRQLHNELDGLRAAFKLSADGIVRELEKERQAATTLRDAEQSRVQELEQKLRAIRLRQVELETRNSHYSVERDAFERAAKLFELKRKNWEEEDAPSFYNEAGPLRRRIVQELVQLRKEVRNEEIGGLTKVIDDALEAVKEEGDGLRNKLMELDFASRRQPRNFTALGHWVTPPMSARRGPLVSEAQARLAELRRQREATRREVDAELKEISKQI
jgi:hypothetical protein